MQRDRQPPHVRTVVLPDQLHPSYRWVLSGTIGRRRALAAHGLPLAAEQLAQTAAPRQAGIDARLEPVEEPRLRAIGVEDAGAVGPAQAALPARGGVPVSQPQVLSE